MEAPIQESFEPGTLAYLCISSERVFFLVGKKTTPPLHAIFDGSFIGTKFYKGKILERVRLPDQSDQTQYIWHDCSAKIAGSKLSPFSTPEKKYGQNNTSSFN
jgi:hypothetical protein